MIIHEELDIWDVIEWGGEALELIGAGLAYEELIAEVCVKEHRAALPCNLHILDSVSYNGNPLKQCTGTFGAISTTPSVTGSNYIDGKLVDTDNFPMQGNNQNSGRDCYYVNDNFIITSFDKGCLLLAFRGIKIDDEGFPMIPDNVSYKKAIKSYISMMIDRIGWRTGAVAEAMYRDSQRAHGTFYTDLGNSERRRVG